ncbi:MAG TPA: hypothetical protein VGM83_00720 [Devosiaceae bacterium]|jgi:hypothetical protein
MFLETLLYAASLPGTPAAYRRHLADGVGIWSRGRRQASAWAPHLRRTRAVIERQAAAIPSRRTVAVLGSGPLFDVPVAALARQFANVVLVDRTHLAPARLQTAGTANVRHLWADLSATLPDMPDLDWVISVNLLSQLGLGAPEHRARQVIDAHLGMLTALPCAVTLITDTAYATIDRSGSLRKRHDLLLGRALPPTDENWTWEVAPFGEDGGDTRRVHQVAAYADWRAALRR